MGALAIAAAGVAVSAGSAYAGYQQNEKANDANLAAQQGSKEDYEARLKSAAKTAKELNAQYNEVVKDRPNLSYESFVRDHLRAIDDPYVRQVYDTAKSADFERLREFGNRATLDNVDNLKKVADELSGGQFEQIVQKRNDLVLNTDAASRYARAYELAAPVRTGASTVRYDSQGRLIEGQRADKQAFSIANEVQTGIEQEQKSDLRQLETDRLQAAQSQVEKAKSFTSFYDPTGYAANQEAQRQSLINGYQALDESRAFDLYKMFAGAAAGITPTQPTYQNNTGGNALISSGVQGGMSALTDYYKYKQSAPSGSSKAGDGIAAASSGSIFD